MSSTPYARWLAAVGQPLAGSSSPRLDQVVSDCLLLRSLANPKVVPVKAPVDPEAAHAEAVADAKRLMRLARTAALATLDPASGAPLTTLVGVASDFDGAPLFLMSTLARHTRHLAADPRASLLLTDEPERGDPLNHPRVTLNGRIERAAGAARPRALSPAQPEGEALRRFRRFRLLPARDRDGSLQRRLRPRRRR